MGKEKNKYIAILAIATIDDTTVDEAQRLFFAYKAQGVIKSEYFEDDIWSVTDEYANYKLNFEIADEMFAGFGRYLNMELSDFKVYLKTFIICQMGDLTLGTMQKIIFGIKKIIACQNQKLEKILDDDSIIFANRISEFFSMLPSGGREREIGTLLEQLDDIEEIMRVRSKSGQRTLAAFESYFRFDDILKQFWNETSDVSEKLFFFPVWLWWNVSAILPLRPREFVLTPRKCIEEMDGHYSLTVRRNRIKGFGKTKSYKINEDYETVKYQIPSELAQEIIWYQVNTDEYMETDLNTLFVADTHYAKWERCKPYTSRYFTYVNLKTCLRYFYEQIVQGRYGYTVIFDRDHSKLSNNNEINYLYLGDTRHLALINLIASGATPMVAMMLAGHDNPAMSSHYYSNITTLIECRTYRQYKKLINGKQTYALSKPAGKLKVGDFIMLGDNSRCYSERVRNDDFSDCYKVSGPSGEIGFCPNCAYHRAEGKTFRDSKDLYQNKIINECKNLEKIVKKVRKQKGESEEITQVLLRLRDEEYSYQKYLMETMGDEDAENKINK